MPTIQVYYNDIRTLYHATINSVFEKYISEDLDRYEFLKNKIYFGYNFPEEQIESRFMVIYGISGQNNLHRSKSSQQFILTLQLIDTGEQTETIRDNTDKSGYLLEIASMLVETGDWMIQSRKLFTKDVNNRRKIKNLIEVNRVSQISTSTTKTNSEWQTTVSFVVEYNIVKFN